MASFKLALPPYRPGSKEERFWNAAPFSQIYWEMRPEDYLNVVPEGERIREGGESSHWPWEHICTRIREGKPIDPPRLVLSSECRVLGHEGRHRAVAALKCGLKKMPVILTCARAEGDKIRAAGTAPCMKCLRRPLKPQDWDSQHSIYDIHIRGKTKRRTGFQDWGEMGDIGSGGMSD